MHIFDTIAEKLGTTRHTVMVLVLLVVVGAAWYIARHAPVPGTSSIADTSNAPVNANNTSGTASPVSPTSYDALPPEATASTLPANIIPPSPYQSAIPPQTIGATVNPGQMFSPSGHTTGIATIIKRF